MSTTSQPLKYLWVAIFNDGHVIEQPENDQYSKHNPDAEWNPSSFRDILDYERKSPLVAFILGHYVVYLDIGAFSDRQKNGFSLEDEPLTDRKLIYYREMRKEWVGEDEHEPYVNAYVMGYEGKDTNGKVHKKTIRMT